MARPGKPSEDEFLHALYQGGELLAAGKVIEAKEHLERAYQLQPKNEKGQNLLGLTYFKLGLFDRAAEIYENLVQENPADPTLRVNLGLVYLKTNAVARAIREFETATDLQPEHKRAHNYLGIALAQTGEYGRARDHFVMAGSDQMAEKMGRAIAGEIPGVQAQAQAGAVLPSYSVPPPARPEALPPRGAQAAPPPTSIEDSSGAEQAAAAAAEYGLPAQVNGAGHSFAHRVDAALARAEAEDGDLVADVVETSEPPAAPRAASPAVSGVLQAQDWGAQFGMDGAAPAPAAAEAEIVADSAATALQRSAGREGAAAEDQFEASFVEQAEAPQAPAPAEVAPVAVEEMPPVELEVSSPGEAAEAVETIETVETVEVVPPAEMPPIEVTVEPPAEERPAAEEVVEEIVADAVVEGGETAPNFAEVRPPGSSGLPLKPLEVHRGEKGKVGAAPANLPIAELAPKVAMFAGAARPGPFMIDSEAVAIVVQGEILTRVVGLVAQSGQLELTPQNRRFRGRTSDQTFGEGEAQLMRVEGKGRLVVQVPGRTLVSVDLDEESAYFLEGMVFGFEEPVAFENGRVPSDVAPDLDLVHLRGKGKVLLSLPGALRSLEVTEQEPVTVPLSNVVGWHGNLSPKVIALTRDRSGKATKAGIELSGEGFALLSMGAG